MQNKRISDVYRFALAFGLVVLAGCGGGKSELKLEASAHGQLRIDSTQALASPQASQTFPGGQSTEFAQGRIIARLDLLPSESGGQSEQRRVVANGSNLRSLGVSITREIDFRSVVGSQQRKLSARHVDEALPRFAILEVKEPGLTVPKAIERLNASGLVRYAEADYRRSLHRHEQSSAASKSAGRALTALPNDPQFGQQWHLDNATLPAADINASAAWDLTTGSRATGAPVIAVFDCGFQLNHPDLAANWWVNPNPTFGDINGADFGSNDGDPSSTTCTHGTQVAGVIGADGNNALGVSGVMWQSQMMALKVADNSGSIFVSYIVSAISYAINQKNAGVNVRVANMSLGDPTFSQAEFDAIKALNAAGILVVASAGNASVKVPDYPGSYNLPNILNVASLNSNDTLSSFSNFGRSVHIAAPGGSILTTSFNTSTFTATYTFASGTSFSAPVVAGVAGLIANYLPAASMQEIRQRILGTADPLSSLNGRMRIPGRVNAHSALTYSGPYSAPSFWSGDRSGFPDQYVLGSTNVVQAYIGNRPETVGVSMFFGTQSVTMKDDGLYPDEFAGDGTYSGTLRPQAVGVQGISVQHSYTVGGVTTSVALSGTAMVAPAANYQVQTVTHAYSEPPFNALQLFSAAANNVLVDVTIPFNINVYGVSTNTIRVSDDGVICVGPRACTDFQYAPVNQHKALPTKTGLPYGLIAPWWNNWQLQSGPAFFSNVFGHVVGSAPNRRVVITWKDVVPVGVSTSESFNGVSFQAQFFEGSTKVVFAYKDVTTSVPSTNTAVHPDGGARGSAGIQFFNGKIATRTAFNQAGSIVAGETKEFTLGASFPAEVTQASDPDLFMSVEGIRGAYITTGCNPGSYCGVDDVNRLQMAAFIARAQLGHDLIANYSGFPPANFPDVTTAPSTNYVAYLKAMGITNGCLGGTAYCPGDPVTREHMALFLRRALRGAAYVPPPAVGIFSDAPPSHPNAATFEELRRMGITNGCLGGTAYCPLSNVTRFQMAQFLQRSFRPWEY